MRILVLLALILILYYLLRGLFRPRTGAGDRVRRYGGMESTGKNELVKDPYCQTYIPKDTALRARIGGEDLFFCSETCMNSYLEEREEQGAAKK
ncbi:MAG: hypothetical protein JRH07_07055 [Deltaproteobacteria bacterium]|nr:hypothetical protein [Deltaproteobacteria bacterium]MBW2121590.1 hypothetical protein [Deltaproteobacteria bacterium]